MSLPELTEVKEKVLSSVLETSAIRVVAPDSPDRPFLIDVMKLAGTTRALKETANAYQYLFRAEKLQDTRRIAGVSPAGETFASLLSFLEKKPLLWLSAVRIPSQRRVAGVLQPGDSVLLVDGLYNYEIIADAAKTIEAEGGLVTDVLVLIADQVQPQQIRVHSLLAQSEIIEYIHSKGAVESAGKLARRHLK
jgi:orotate phosphoribosyltransferase